MATLVKLFRTGKNTRIIDMRTAENEPAGISIPVIVPENDERVVNYTYRQQ